MQARELDAGLWGWSARHPEWEPGHGWDEQVWCWCADGHDVLLLIDPLVPQNDAATLLRHLDGLAHRRMRPVAIVLTQAAHVRDAGVLARRFDATVWGHEAVREKLDGAPFRAIAAGDLLAGGARVLPFDQEVGGSGTPLYLPEHRAVAVGDVFLAVDGELRAWWGSTHAGGRGWYDEHARPSLRQWLELDVDHVLVAHGEPIDGGAAALSAALERPPYELD